MISVYRVVFAGNRNMCDLSYYLVLRWTNCFVPYVDYLCGHLTLFTSKGILYPFGKRKFRVAPVSFAEETKTLFDEGPF